MTFRLFYEFRLIKYVMTSYDEPFTTKVISLCKYYKWNIKNFLVSLGLMKLDISKVGVEIEGDWKYD